MSYINDALKKAQKEKNSSLSSYQEMVAECSSSKKVSFPINSKLWISVALILLALVGYSWFKPQTKIREESQKEIKNENAGTDAYSRSQRTKPDSVFFPRADKNNFSLSVPLKKASVPKPDLRGRDMASFVKATSFYKKGVESQVAGDHQKAIGYYEKSIAIQKDMAPALNNLGVLYMQEGCYENALKNFEAAIKTSPSYVDPYYNTACLYSKMQKYNNALIFFKKAVNISKEVKIWAETDSDLKPLFELNEFKKIVTGN
ncbi:putative Tetratricopeptide repeat protein [Candidatus Magnetomoraceae bacterium gMMP-1]